MTHVWGVLQRWIDAQKIPPTQAQLSRLLGVSRGTITNWKTDTVPKPAQIDTIVERTGIPKSELLTAVLRDQGYLRVEAWGEEVVADERSAASITTPPGTISDEVAETLPTDEARDPDNPEDPGTTGAP